MVMERADTVFVEGSFPYESIRIEEHMHDHSSKETPITAALRMMRAYALAHTQGLFHEGLELANTYEGTRKHAHGCELPDASVSPYLAAFV